MRASRDRRTRATVVSLGAAIFALAMAPGAQAQFGLTGAAATPASTDAGANTDVTLGFDVQEPEHDLRNLTVHLPPGLIGNPQAAPMCTEAQLNSDSCPAASDVGDVTNEINVFLLPMVPTPLTVNGDIYNLVPQPGEPARFGIRLEPTVGDPIVLQSPAALRQSDLGLDTILNDLPNQAVLLGPLSVPIDITGVSLTLSGTAGSPPQGFIRLPTSCKAHTVGFDAASYDGDTASAQAQFTTTNCGALPFTPELSARIKRTGPVNEPVELSTTIAQTIEEAGLLRAQVVLPAALGGNNEVLNNQCTTADFEAGTCPPTSIVGTASATSPLQSQALSGPVALLNPAVPGLPDLGIDLRGPLALKLKGTLAFTPEGRNIVVFDNLPDIPIAEFTLTFAGGPTGLVAASRDVCEPPDLIFDAIFNAHSGATLATTATPTIDCSAVTGGGGNGGARKKPRATVKLSGLGGKRPTMKLKVRAGSDKLRQAKLRLPKQLRFAKGKRFDRGATASKVSVKHTERVLKLKPRKAAKRLTAKIGDGALKARRGLDRDARPAFKLAIRDAAGKTTRLKVKAK